MRRNIYCRNFIKRMTNIAASFSKLSVVWLLILILISFVEIGYNGFTRGLQYSITSIIIWSIINDLLVWLKWIIYLYFIYTLLFLMNKKVARIGYVIFIVLKWLPSWINPPKYIAYLLPVLSLLFVLTDAFNLIEAPSFKTDFSNNLVLNKSDYFFSSSYRYFYPDEYETDIYADNYIGYFEGFGSKFSSFQYVDENKYPFLHIDSTQDVLSPFLI